MKWSVERSPEARADLLDIWTYIAEDNPAAADHQIDSVDRIFDLLRAYPEIGRSRDDIRTGLRGFTRGHYLILYQLDHRRKMVQIIRVVHGMRNLAALFA
jgi:toxin ParE1/3/4